MQTYSEAENQKRYIEKKIIGCGGYGKVSRFKDMQSGGEYVAIKKVKLDVTL